MVKICRHCFKMFEGHISIDNCPMRKCGGWELIKIDDMLADVIIRFWAKGISTLFSCSGHLYESCFSPYVMFDGPNHENGRESLKFYRGILLEWNDKDQVSIGEIEYRFGKYVFTVRANQCKNDPIQRLRVQSDFIDYLYDIAEFVPSDIFERHLCACACAES